MLIKEGMAPVEFLVPYEKIMARLLLLLENDENWGQRTRVDVFPIDEQPASRQFPAQEPARLK